MPSAVSLLVGETLGKIAPEVKTVLWPALGVIFAIYVLVSLILLYHWRKYALHNRKIVAAESVYFVVSITLLAIASFALIFA